MICGSCHSLDSEYRVVGNDGWILSKQQFSEMWRSPHNTGSPHYGYYTCLTCHSQHQTSLYEQGGLREEPSCSTCHPDHEIPGKEYLDCITCHMPRSVRSLNVNGEFRADMRSHLFKIWVTEEPRDSMYYTDETGTWLKLDNDGMSYGNTLDLVCLQCHSSWSIDYVYPFAENIHTEGLGIEFDDPIEPVGEFLLQQNYPNPFNPVTTIEFTVPVADQVTLSVYDLRGQLIETIVDQPLNPGRYRFEFTADGQASGVYIYRLESTTLTLYRKMLLLK